jgi:hypothetical protein
MRKQDWDLYLAAAIDGIVPYYTEGVENVAWVVGALSGDGSQSKESNHLYLNAYDKASGNTATRSYVTDALIDLTNVKTLYIDWESTGTSTAQNRCFFVVSSDKTGEYSVQTLGLEIQNTFSRTISSLDVSSLTGQHYIRVHSRDNSGTANQANSIIKVYRVWGEE